MSIPYASIHSSLWKVFRERGISVEGNVMITLSSLMGGSYGDAIGQLGYGGTAPTGTDYTATIQAGINSIGANSTGAVLIWDGAWGISAPILIPSNFTLYAPNKSCGAILRASSNCPMLVNSGALNNDASSSKQNTFGKINPTPGGDQKYRILNSSFIANRNIAIIGGTWNGNRAGQAGKHSTTMGLFNAITMLGVDGLHIEGVQTFTTSGYGFHVCNYDNVVIRDCILDQSPTPAFVTDTIHFNGPGGDAAIYNVKCHSGDDCVSFTADDVNTAGGIISTGNAGFACGTNYPCSGAMRSILVDGLDIFDGAEGVAQVGGFRLLSNVARIDNVEVRNVFGATTGACMSINNWSGALIGSGAGNIGRVNFKGIHIAFSSPLGTSNGMARFSVDCQVDALNIDGSLIDPPDCSDLYIGGTSGGGLNILNYHMTCQVTAAGTNRAQPLVLIAGPMYTACIRAESFRPAVTQLNSPIVRTASGASVAGMIEVDAWLDRSTVMFDHAVGTVNSVALRGMFATANSGKPLKIAAGLTIKNGSDVGLQYVNASGVGVKAGFVTLGAGAALTNYNDYAD